MTDRRAIEAALGQAGLPSSISSLQPLSGGCIHQVQRIMLADGRSLVAKTNHADRRSILEGEREGLTALRRTNTVHVPRVLCVIEHQGTVVLLMEWLEPDKADEAVWRRFGGDLASLHAVPVGDLHGFDHDNHLGLTPQPNGWCGDWVEFIRTRRLGHQRRLAVRRGLLQPHEVVAIDRVLDRLDRLLPGSPRPSLLHGDLWSGNVLPVKNERGEVRMAMIDPACWIGDAMADIAMMRLFGGFPASCFEAYQAASGLCLDDDGARRSIRVHQLYHVLNHLNLFGRTYAAQVMSICAELV